MESTFIRDWLIQLGIYAIRIKFIIMCAGILVWFSQLDYGAPLSIKSDWLHTGFSLNILSVKLICLKRIYIRN